MNLAYGLMGRAVPEDVKTAWGARLIAPDDLVHDRQDLVAESDEAKAELIEWLNPGPRGGAIGKALNWLRANYETMPQSDDVFTLYEDERGKIVGSTNGSFGYVYCSGWLKTEQAERYELVRGPIPAERWEKVYGWSAAEAAKMDGQSSDVRLYHVASDGTRREIDEDKGSKFEFGYGGTGPHDSARAIVTDALGTDGEVSPATLRELVPEVFARDDDQRVVVIAADVKRRLGK